MIAVAKIESVKTEKNPILRILLLHPVKKAESVVKQKEKTACFSESLLNHTTGKKGNRMCCSKNLKTDKNEAFEQEKITTESE